MTSFYSGINQGEDLNGIPHDHARILAEMLNEKDEDENNT